ncbi:MAG TPA: caspase family protein [Terracidiphilus sp.]|nr:caspase family protein [Terracidiphilus sp.]
MLPIAVSVFLLGACISAQAQDDRCGAGKDLVVQALERVTPQSGNDAFGDALQLLKHAVAECPELGDAWYYRSLVEKRLGHDVQAKYAMDKASFNGSEALQQGLNPLVLSTPASRGLSAVAGSESASTPSSVPVGPVNQKWALVVGIGKFGDTGVPALRFTTADANGIANALKDPAIGRFPPANVHVLTDEQATTKNIKEELNWIARHAQPNDLVLIYVATHGTPRTLDSSGGANYLVTYDTEISAGSGVNEDALYATAYPMVDLANAVATRMKSLRTAVILDTCYSAGSIKTDASSVSPIASSAPSDQMLKHMTDGTGRIVIAASGVNEESLESPDLKHGYFTYFLLQALEKGKGRTPLSQIFASVAKQVSQSVNTQHPVMSRSSPDADFAIGDNSTATASSEP